MYSKILVMGIMSKYCENICYPPDYECIISRRDDNNYCLWKNRGDS